MPGNVYGRKMFRMANGGMYPARSGKRGSRKNIQRFLLKYGGTALRTERDPS